MQQHARDVVFKAIESGWSGPPYDPIALADQMKIRIAPSADVKDARTVPAGPGQRGVRIEFNPNRPKRRMRYSIAHEIAHTFFPDWFQRIRHRGGHDDDTVDNWQLETLCNIGAAEILMPVAPLQDDIQDDVGIDEVLILTEKYDVSVEAILIRTCNLSQRPITVFVASNHGKAYQSSYTIDYAISRARNQPIRHGMKLPADSAVSECTAIGYTAKRRERWPGIASPLFVEFVGLPPYPGSTQPRVAGIAKPLTHHDLQPAKLEYLRGDALSPRGAGNQLIAHIVNNRTANWGGAGFAMALKRAFPDVQSEFRNWTREHRAMFQLGNIHVADITGELSSVQMIAQAGYGPSTKPRIRYQPLQQCLRAVADLASRRRASVHMPRIGAGHARGHWPIIEDLIYENLVARGIFVTVYDLPTQNKAPDHDTQGVLSFS